MPGVSFATMVGMDAQAVDQGGGGAFGAEQDAHRVFSFEGHHAAAAPEAAPSSSGCGPARRAWRAEGEPTSLIGGLRSSIDSQALIAICFAIYLPPPPSAGAFTGSPLSLTGGGVFAPLPRSTL